MTRPIYKLRENIPPHIIYWPNLSKNENAIPILEQYKEHIDWDYLACNKNTQALEWLEKTLPREKIRWEFLSKNPVNKALDILEKNHENISWKTFTLNENDRAMSILEKNIDKIDWRNLCFNKNPRSIPLLVQYEKKISWKHLSANSSDIATDILFRNMDKIDWTSFSFNSNPRVIQYIEQELLPTEKKKKINWYWLSRNPSAISILERNMDKIDWTSFCLNASIDAIPLFDYYLNNIYNNQYTYQGSVKNICLNPYSLDLLFTYDYKKMDEKNKEFTNSLFEIIYHPQRLDSLSHSYNLTMQQYIHITFPNEYL